ncbi:MAG: NYN domain-containing protein [Clostridiales bacterium]
MKEDKKKTIAFIDYEYWRFGLLNQYKLFPDIKSWLEELQEMGNITEIYFFYDFTNKLLQSDYKTIARISQNIINTQNPNGNTTKDYTDFVMLDSIYQKYIFLDTVEQFILFTGDGHFNSVVSFLAGRGKTVGIYAINGSLNDELAARASWVKIINNGKDIYYEHAEALLNSIYNLEIKQNTDSNIKATFIKTIEATHQKTGLAKEELRNALSSLIDKQYIQQIKSEKLTYLQPDWSKISLDGLYTNHQS